jgi:hypothetical protein
VHKPDAEGLTGLLLGYENAVYFRTCASAVASDVVGTAEQEMIEQVKMFRHWKTVCHYNGQPGYFPARLASETPALSSACALPDSGQAAKNTGHRQQSRGQKEFTTTTPRDANIFNWVISKE